MKMARCALTGKRARRANIISHAHNKTPKWQRPNIQRKRIWVDELGRFVRLPLSTRAIRTISKVGFSTYARKNGIDIHKLA